MTSTVSIDKLLNIKSKVCYLEMALILSGESLRYIFYVNCQWKIKENNPYNQGFSLYKSCITSLLQTYNNPSQTKSR